MDSSLGWRRRRRRHARTPGEAGFVPDRAISDDLRSHGAAAGGLPIVRRRKSDRRGDNRIETSRRSTRRRKRKMQRFKHAGLGSKMSPALTPHMSKLSRRSDEQSARRSRHRLTTRETQALRTPRSTTRQSRSGSPWVYDRGAIAPCVDSESFFGRSCWLKVWNKSQGGEYSQVQALGGRHTRFV